MQSGSGIDLAAFSTIQPPLKQKGNMQRGRASVINPQVRRHSLRTRERLGRSKNLIEYCCNVPTMNTPRRSLICRSEGDTAQHSVAGVFKLHWRRQRVCKADKWAVIKKCIPLGVTCWKITLGHLAVSGQLVGEFLVPLRIARVKPGNLVPGIG